MKETTQDKPQTSLTRCHQCGKVIESPYKSYILSSGNCCGLELLDFCSEECFEESEKEKA